MQKSKDNSTIYAFSVIAIITLIVVGSKFTDKFNFESLSEPIEVEEMVTEPVLEQNAFKNEEVIEQEVSNPLARFFDYEGQYALKVNLLYNQPVASRLEGLIGTVRLQQMRHYWKTDTPIYIEDGILIAKGCAQRNCDETNFVVMMDLANDAIFAGVKIEGITEVFAENSESIVPLERWRSQNNRIVNVQNVSGRSFTSNPNFSALSNYYNDISNKNFNVNRHFADYVEQFQNFENTTPDQINQILSTQGRDTRSQTFTFDVNSMVFSESENDIHYYNFLVRIKCYRISKKRNEDSEVRMQVGFDSNGQIASLTEIRTESMIYTN